MNVQVALILTAFVPLLGAHPWAMAGSSLLAVPYIVLAFGLAVTPLFAGIGRRSDISYGVYLWGGPVQQLCISALGWALSPILLAAISLPAAYVMGWASWHLIERRALLLNQANGCPARTPRHDAVRPVAGPERAGYTIAAQAAPNGPRRPVMVFGW